MIYDTGAIPHSNVANNYLVGNFSQTCSDQNNNSILLDCDTSACTVPNPVLIGNLARNGNDTSGLVIDYADEVTSGNYQPLAGSPLIDAGTDGNCAVSPGISPCIPLFDFDGIERQESTEDIGAFTVQ
ncbi:MAG TPA: choice-of-anchor Q domain-containing protein [Candidatus Eremiobacteraceae bacterium]|nr:choice-of-anchor Q domain-containing protein [Candidatus Eremiobacteraceae bacterium]